MGTQAVISVMKNNEVIAKLIVGCNGSNIKDMVRLLKIEHTVDIEVFYKMAINIGFGCKNCLVVMDKDRVCKSPEIELSELYRRTFDLPNFNPRWKEGTADYIGRIKL